MKSLKESLTNEAIRGNKFESPCKFVETRNSKCSIFLGSSLEFPYAQSIVKKICKDMGIKYYSVEDAWDEDDWGELWNSITPCAVIEDGELVWYDLNDGTIVPYKL